MMRNSSTWDKPQIIMVVDLQCGHGSQIEQALTSAGYLVRAPEDLIEAQLIAEERLCSAAVVSMNVYDFPHSQLIESLSYNSIPALVLLIDREFGAVNAVAAAMAQPGVASVGTAISFVERIVFAQARS